MRRLTENRFAAPLDARGAEAQPPLLDETLLDATLLAPTAAGAAPHEGSTKPLPRGWVLPLPGQETGPATSERGSPSKAPSAIGPYAVERELARGGMGIVYVARHRRLERRVALKVLAAGELAGEDEVQRFQVEARAAARLKHPAIVGIHEVGREGPLWYLAMDLIVGRSLKARLDEEGPLPGREAAALLEQLARALHYAHTQAILHRDLKPQNVLLDAEGRAYVTDFGLAKEVGRADGLTATGDILGTPAYMAPEQAEGDLARVDRRADVYGLGATLYAILVGRAPFSGSGALQILRQVLEDEPVAPRQLRPDLDPDLETICLACLEKEPERRYATAGELADDLARYLADEPIRARPTTGMDRLRKWGRRNSVLVGSLTATAFLALLAIAGVSVALVRVARTEAEDARRARLEERRAREAAQESAKEAARQGVRADAERARAQAQAAAAERRERLAAEGLLALTQELKVLAQEPERPIGAVQQQLTQTTVAVLRDLRDAYRADPAADISAEAGWLCLRAADLLWVQGRIEEAAAEAAEAVALFDRLLAAGPSPDDAQRWALGRAQAARIQAQAAGATLRANDELGSAQATLEAARAVAQTSSTTDEERGGALFNVARALLEVAQIHMERDDLAAAEAALDEAAASLARAEAFLPREVSCHRLELWCVRIRLLQVRAATSEADALLSRALRLSDELGGASVVSPWVLRQVAYALTGLADEAARLGRMDDAEAALARQALLLERVAALAGRSLEDRRHQALGALRSGVLGVRRGRAGAAARLDRARQLLEALYDEAPSRRAGWDLIEALMVAVELRLHVRPEVAWTQIERALELGRKLSGDAAPGRLTPLLERKAQVALLTGRRDQARRAAEEGLRLAQAERRRLPHHADTLSRAARMHDLLAVLAGAEERPAEGLPHCAEARRLLEEAARLAPRDRELRYGLTVAREHEALLRRQVGERDAALQALLDVVAGRERLLEEEPADARGRRGLAVARVHLAELHLERGAREAALPLLVLAEAALADLGRFEPAVRAEAERVRRLRESVERPR